MKILVLTCNTGEGHNHAAQALKIAFEEDGDQVQIAEALSFQGKDAGQKSERTYYFAIRFLPWLFGLVYKMGKLYDKSKFPSPVLFANRKGTKKLAEVIETGEFEAVISVHVFAGEMLTQIKKQKRLENRPKFYMVLTDFIYTPFFGEPQMDGYFLPNQESKEGLLRRAISEKKLHVTGIPTAPKFSVKFDQNALKKQLGFSEKGSLIAIITGGVAIRKLKQLVHELLREIPRAEFVVFAGKNRKIQMNVKNEFFDYSNVTILKYVENIEQYMQAADLVVGKPGGLSSAEVFSIRKPMVQTLPIPGGETENAEYLSSKSLIVYEKKAKRAARAAAGLIQSPGAAFQMLEAQNKLAQGAAVYQIVAEVKNETR